MHSLNGTEGRPGVTSRARRGQAASPSIPLPGAGRRRLDPCVIPCPPHSSPEGSFPSHRPVLRYNWLWSALHGPVPPAANARPTLITSTSSNHQPATAASSTSRPPRTAKIAMQRHPHIPLSDCSLQVSSLDLQMLTISHYVVHPRERLRARACSPVRAPFVRPRPGPGPGPGLASTISSVSQLKIARSRDTLNKVFVTTVTNPGHTGPRARARARFLLPCFLFSAAPRLETRWGLDDSPSIVPVVRPQPSSLIGTVLDAQVPLHRIAGTQTPQWDIVPSHRSPTPWMTGRPFQNQPVEFFYSYPLSCAVSHKLTARQYSVMATVHGQPRRSGVRIFPLAHCRLAFGKSSGVQSGLCLISTNQSTNAILAGPKGSRCK